MAVSGIYIRGCLKRVPKCPARASGFTMSTFLLCGNVVVLLIFPAWCTFRLLELYGQPLAAIASVPYGDSILWTPPPSVFGTGLKVDLFVEVVELSIGWLWCLGIGLLPLRVPESGEPLVLDA